MLIRSSILIAGFLAGLASMATAEPPDTAFSTIRGTATDTADLPLPNAMVRLRDARLGRILDARTTDKTGAFSFSKIDPGSYVVELVGRANAVVAVTPIVSLNAGDTAIVTVRLPAGPSFLAALFGQPRVLSAAAGSTPLIPAMSALVPQGILLAIPAIVPIGSPVSER